ncbi:SMP-30/gluconolactonase/LRE family protein [Lacimicrobium sp. SS2-24]|uniref:SMP-30/gluconolactonase/LRE family protein n=1 Tax=Lacimicrobium sp. SS2-24 TaxID=2005569 RepID=UPI000B4AD3AA|nr:SMP-30/gluconolactonase/LRE family protein [Lacimicrobium sp. SS2-24]
MAKTQYLLTLITLLFTLPSLASPTVIDVKVTQASPQFTQTWGKLVGVRILTSSLSWAEGPAWDASSQTLYFTDVPQSKLYQWRANEGVKMAMSPSGLAVGHEGFRETGINGLIAPGNGTLLAANTGERRIDVISLSNWQKTPLIESADGRHFNSPNDLIQSRTGDLFFTDPPYGLTGGDDSPLKQQPVNGVWHFDGKRVHLIDGTLTRPNGIVLMNNDTTLLVSNSSADNPVIMRYERDHQGHFGTPVRWFDMSAWITPERWNGLPDGMAVTESGLVFATGPGGLYVLSDSGSLAARITFDRPLANVALDEQNRTLFVANQNRLLRLVFEQ